MVTKDIYEAMEEIKDLHMSQNHLTITPKQLNLYWLTQREFIQEEGTKVSLVTHTGK